MSDTECLCGVCPPCTKAWREIALELEDPEPPTPMSNTKSDIVEQIMAEVRKKKTVRRRARPVSEGAERTHCDLGHSLTGENKGTSKNGNGYAYPYCKKCKADRERERNRTKRAKSA